jgi:hypothetical protein
MSKYHQGKYTVRYPEKYVGDPTNVTFRSSWEKKVMIWLDSNPDCLKWGSEEKVIPYISPIDGRAHRYFTDFIAAFRTRTGEVKRVIIEVKPKAQTMPPIKPSKTTKRYVEAVQTYITNTAKWKAANEWCVKNGYEFHLITEDHLKV